MSTQIAISTTTVSASIEAVVTRCGCGAPQEHSGEWGVSSPCPRPRRVDNLGVVAYYHRNLIKRLLWKLIGRHRAGARIEKANRS